MGGILGTGDLFLFVIKTQENIAVACCKLCNATQYTKIYKRQCMQYPFVKYPVSRNWHKLLLNCLFEKWSSRKKLNE